jgi:hypothetical protein
MSLEESETIKLSSHRQVLGICWIVYGILLPSSRLNSPIHT